MPIIENTTLTAGAFLFQTVAISLSGVMAPGPLSAVAIADGSRSRYAGLYMALGHGIIEFPLMFALMAGVGFLLQSEISQFVIAIAGGLFLIWMGRQMFGETGEESNGLIHNDKRHPLTAGTILTLTNPFFLLWWATVGVNFIKESLEFGFIVFALFAGLHWMCDLVWLLLLSIAGYSGSRLLSSKNQLAVYKVCGLILIGFGAWFIIKGFLA